MKMTLSNHGGRAHFLCTSDREAGVGRISNVYSTEELAQLRDGIITYLNALPKPHVHAEKMMQYAKDAAITDKPWELWEVNWNVNNPKWTTLAGNPKWCPDYEYRRKLNAMG